MARIWKIEPRIAAEPVRGAGAIIHDIEHTPPGLLLSLGDGSAVECTLEMLAKAVMTRVGHFEDEFDLAKATIDALIQQAQEARDA